MDIGALLLPRLDGGVRIGCDVGGGGDDWLHSERVVDDELDEEDEEPQQHIAHELACGIAHLKNIAQEKNVAIQRNRVDSEL